MAFGFCDKTHKAETTKRVSTAKFATEISNEQDHNEASPGLGTSSGIDLAVNRPALRISVANVSQKPSTTKDTYIRHTAYGVLQQQLSPCLHMQAVQPDSSAQGQTQHPRINFSPSCSVLPEIVVEWEPHQQGKEGKGKEGKGNGVTARGLARAKSPDAICIASPSA